VPDQAHANDASRPCVAITFDDGFANNHENALPILLDHGVTATFFITTGLVNADERVSARFSRLLSIEREHVRGLSWSQVQELQAEGMSIGAHTVTHPNLRVLAPADANREIELSKLELEDRLGVAVRGFAYPFGKPKHHFTETTIRQVEDSGFSHAVAVHFRGVSPGSQHYRIPRFSVAHDDVTRLSRKVRGREDGLGVWQQTAPRWLSHLVSPSHSFGGEMSLIESPEAG
jgi:peptidoglycan/xylan/chitin deacetylase (PgdA/CDA1 family)